MWVLLAMASAAGAPGAPSRADLQNMFMTVDRNGDGYVVEDEAPRITRVRVDSSAGGTVRQVGSWIARYDADGDGRVSRTEFVNHAAAEIASY
ncbi:MAG: EF-hand domain-containing protein [Allosphingosinicella sp.]